MKFASAQRTRLCLALWASGALPAFFCVEVRWPDPDATACVGAVDAVASVVFVVFLVKVNFEFEVEEIFHMRQGNVIGGAASRWHMGGIVNRHAKETLQA